MAGEDVADQSGGEAGGANEDTAAEDEDRERRVVTEGPFEGEDELEIELEFER